MSISFGAQTKEAIEIREKSMAIARSFVQGNSPEDKIRRRCVIATGDPEFARLLRFTNEPITAGIDAVKRNATIFTDIRMAQVGITKKGHRCEVKCALDAGEGAVEKTDATRTSAGFASLGKELNGSIIVIGNAPSATITVCNMVERGIMPALIIATPVGFVNAAESKELVRNLKLPSITCVGTRGGTPVAVAVMNELVEMASQLHS